MIDLVKSVGEKMKGFSRKETIAYYQDIMKRAWAQVEAADTPEVKSAKFDEVMEWTMLDKDYDDRTREVFQHGPVFVPVWWPRYDPSFGKPTSGPVSSGTPGGSLSLPHLPGSDFAAGIVLGVQNFSSSVVGNIGDFTSGITNITNPPPKPPASSGRSYSSGRSGGSRLRLRLRLCLRRLRVRLRWWRADRGLLCLLDRIGHWIKSPLRRLGYRSTSEGRSFT